MRTRSRDCVSSSKPSRCALMRASSSNRQPGWPETAINAMSQAHLNAPRLAPKHSDFWLLTSRLPYPEGISRAKPLSSRLAARKRSRDGHRSLTVAARIGAASVSDGLRKGTKPAGHGASFCRAGRSSTALQTVNQAGHVAGAEAVVDVHHRDVRGATVEHAEQGGEAVETGAIADAGGDGDHRAGNHAAHHAGKRTLHAGADHDDAGFGEAFAVAHEAVDAGHADIVDGVDFIAHQFRGDPGFLGDRHIAGAGANHGDAAFAVNGAVAPETDGAGEDRVFAAGQLGGDGGGANRVGAGDQNIARILQQAGGDGDHVIGGLALGEDDLWNAVPQGAMVIHLGEAQVFKGHVAHARDGGIDIDRAVTDLLEQGTELILVHESRVSKRRLSPLQYRIMTAHPTKVLSGLGLFCAFRTIVSRAGVLDDRSRMEISTSEGSARFGGMTDRRGTSRFPVQEDVK